MDAAVTTLQLPTTLYADLAAEEKSDPIKLLTRLIHEARQRRSLRRTWDELCDQVERDGGLKIGKTTEEIVEQVRKTRQEIFEVEYAHLYR